MFDDNSRHENKKNHMNRNSVIYGDAKHTSLDENIFDYKSYHHQSIITAAIPSSRHVERVKQKFDKPNPSNSPSSSSRNGKKARNFSSFLKFNNKRGEATIDNNDESALIQTPLASNINLTKSIDSLDSTKVGIGDSLNNKKKDVYMNSSMNLDGLKVSEDDDDDDEVSILM